MASPEQVAFFLMKLIANNEGKSLDHSSFSDQLCTVDRDYLLDLYADCLEATRGERPILKEARRTQKKS